MSILQHIPEVVTAVGGLGTAAFGLVDATKVFWGGVNHVGFSKIESRVSALTPVVGQGINALTQEELLKTLKANWFNGTDLSSQKAIAKSLIKLHMNPDNAAALAKATNVAPELLSSVASNIASGATLTQAQSDVYARFDFIVTALLDETYQDADQDYRNGTKALAVVFSLALAITSAQILNSDATAGFTVSIWEAIVVGILATPLAPIAKDISTALTTAVNALQIVKK